METIIYLLHVVFNPVYWGGFAIVALTLKAAISAVKYVMRARDKKNAWARDQEHQAMIRRAERAHGYEPSRLVQLTKMHMEIYKR